MNENSYLGRYFERTIVLLILLVMVQTFFEEYTTFMAYNVLVRKYVLAAGFGFDLIFSIEFLFRLFISGKRGSAAGYMAHEGGFIDLFSSLPLLLFHSGPLVLITFFSGEAGLLAVLGGISFLKIVKVIRVARTLRFIRTLKILGKIKQRYRMTPKFISKVVSLVITIIVISLIGFSFVNNGNVIQSNYVEVQKLLKNYIESNSSHNFNDLLSGTDSVLFIDRENETIYRSITRLFFQNNYLYDDYYITRVHDYEIYFNNKDMKKTLAFINMIAFSMIIGIIIAVSIIYKRFFNKHIVRVINVMLKGFRTEDYSTAVRINERKKDFEIYQMADQYNRKWLPVKRKIIEIRRRKF